jgi:hypothetical protein
MKPYFCQTFVLLLSPSGFNHTSGPTRPDEFQAINAGYLAWLCYKAYMSDSPQPLVSHNSGPLRGVITPPGDKSISHRSIMLGGIATGTTTVRGLLEGEDVLHTVAALRALGARITKNGSVWRIEGTGLEGLRQPTGALDMGNSGTSGFAVQTANGPRHHAA